MDDYDRPPTIYRWQVQTDDDKRRLNEAFGRPECEVNCYKSCPICGALQWAHSFHKRLGEDDESIQYLTHDLLNPIPPCDDCQEVSRRAPEVVKWMLNVIENRSFRDRKGEG